MRTAIRTTAEPAASPTHSRPAQPSTDVLAAIGHDLQDPLAGILMGAQLLLRTAEDERTVRVLEAIRRAGERMSLILRNAGTVGGQPLGLQRRPQPIAELLSSACGKLDELAARRSVRVERRFAVGEAVAFCDGPRMIETLLMVGDNAVRHAGGHPVVVDAKVGPDAWTVRVTDKGTGIARERLPTIFDWAFNSSQPSREGPGFGLAAARRIVEGHGGTIRVESRVGRGTKCSIVLPLVGAVPKPAVRNTEETSQCSTS